MKVEIRPQRVYDAKRFFEILSNPQFKYFPAKPNTVEEERKFLRLNRDKLKTKTEFNFSIICDEKHVGGIGVRIDQHRTYIGEIGFFIDEHYWGKGIAFVALEQLEEFVTSNLQISRIEIRMAKENRASQKIAMKSGYKKEGVLRQMLFVEDKWYDCYLYSKIL
jgi:ribosomal-protein-alanine N-acetyltransferase